MRKPDPQPLSKWAIAPDALRRVCTEQQLGFNSTEELSIEENLIHQKRALSAISFGCEMNHDGYNLFVYGPQATGKHKAVRAMLTKLASTQPAADDWVYVNNFAEPDKPVAIKLPPGRAARFKASMRELVEDLSATVPALFESDDYRTRRQAIENEVEQAREQAFENLRREAQTSNIAILRTPMGFALAPMRNGEVIKPEEFNALPESERKAIEKIIEQLQSKLELVIQALPGLEKQRQARIREINTEVVNMAVSTSIKELRQAYRDIDAVGDYLTALEADLAPNVELFLHSGSAAPEEAISSQQLAENQNLRFKRYDVNAIVCNVGDGRDGGSAPLIEERIPNLHNLTGKIDHISKMGALLTDFTLIKPGALHKANGGYLMLDARRVLTEPFAWEALKRCLQAGEISISSLAEHLSLSSTVSLQPDPIPLKVKVVLIGSPLLYYLLANLDPDFGELFKVESEFDHELDWSAGNLKLYARLIGSIAKKEGLLPLNANGVGEVISEASRMTDDRKKLSLQVGYLCDLLREADHWSRTAKRKQITAQCVQRAVVEKNHRRNLIEERSQERILRKIALIDTSGEAVGQVNGLSVIDLGRYRFGRPSRITARTRAGTGKVVDIEREVKLGGPLHSKGVLILSSFLASHYALDMPMSLWASLVFEQSYGGIDGDSASSAELYALLSALSEVPIRQKYAVTGSVNQNGEVQAIGGVNEKIEGFFDICKKRRLKGSQGVLIPKANAQHLMLRPDVVEAVKKSRFHVFAVEHIDEGIEILTARKAGVRARDGNYPAGSVNALVEQKLVSYAKMRLRFGVSGEQNKVQD